ncbi:hypothetical protein [Stakelama saccharophila]|uniref:Uncharacterized protein n=1 Tax=Stakelama saccharophila TaxID=3075605 RepID=A0ABZ0B7N7_9SPHN|nr:hypothetical protein [Stakelama sp. W311]WNO53237.1 hypothetical protein RPR59_12405 [Stakelama sp. W311]
MNPFAISLAAPALLASNAPQQQPVFAPPVNRPLRYATKQTRTDGAVTRMFRIERTLVFHRATDGYVAELTIDRVDSDTGDPTGALFETGMAAFLGRTLRFHLDAAGTVTRIEDQDALWSVFADALAEQMGRKATAKAQAKILRGLKAMPESRRRVVLGSMLQAAVRPDIVVEGVEPVHAVRRKARPPFGHGEMLDGTARSWRMPGGILRRDSNVSGDISVPGSADRTAHLVQKRSLKVDPRSGLLRESRKVLRLSLGDVRQVHVTETRLGPAPSGAGQAEGIEQQLDVQNDDQKRNGPGEATQP